MTNCKYQEFPSELTHGSLSEAWSASARGMDSETQFSDIHGLLHLDQIWWQPHLKYHFQFHFALVLEPLSQACLNQLTSPLLLKQDGALSLPVLK